MTSKFRNLVLPTWILVFGAATVITLILIDHRHGSFMTNVLVWTKHTSHIDEIGREGHFERLAMEMMWRFVFHAGAIGWCIAVGCAYWIATRRSNRGTGGVPVSETLARAYARNPLAFVTDAGLLTGSSSQIAQMRNLAANLLNTAKNSPKVQSTNQDLKAAPSLVIDWRKHPLTWLRSGGAQRWIAFAGIAGFVIQLLIYVIFVRPHL